MVRQKSAVPFLSTHSSAQAVAPSLSETVAIVLTDWRSSAALTEQTLARMSETVTRFGARLSVLGVSSFGTVTTAQAAGFVRARTRAGSPPEVATQHARRTALRTLYRTLRSLGLHDGDPTLDLRLPPRGLLAARPLTDDEVTLCRASAQVGAGAASPRRTVAWALGETGAVTSEITALALGDLIDLLEEAGRPVQIKLPGTRRHDPRIGDLTPWGQQVLRRRVAQFAAVGAPASTLLAYGGQAPPGGAKAQASVCNAVREVLDAAGLADEPDVRPASLRNWAGRRLFDAGAPIDVVAARLGCRSLDAAAEDIALTWRGVSA